jgi:hypothetical protein
MEAERAGAWAMNDVAIASNASLFILSACLVATGLMVVVD